ncbi:MAG: N-6 DNA methylase [Candidatus Sericytochromatia bacterium]|nr:N-6 DNA methylase [Candidatus Sericytochromatia bacterium]
MPTTSPSPRRTNPLVLALRRWPKPPEKRGVDDGMWLSEALADLMDHLLEEGAPAHDAPLGPGFLRQLPAEQRVRVLEVLPTSPSIEELARLREEAMALRPGPHGELVLASGKGKHAGGAWATPPEVSATLAGLTLGPWLAEIAGRPDAPARLADLRVLDPACGHGALLAAARELLARCWQQWAGLAPDHALARATGQLLGADVDPWAIRLARRHLGPHAALVCRDSLVDPWPEEWPERVSAVLANPPFLSQLHRDTARTSERQALLRRTWGPCVRGHVDDALIFGVVGAKVLAEGGRMGILWPESALATRDGTLARQEIRECAAPVGLWQAGSGLFTAQVRIVAVILERGARPAKILTWQGPRRTPGPVLEPLTTGQAWSSLLAGGEGIPTVVVRTRDRLGARARITADFRDQYYGLVPFVQEAPDVDALPAHLAPFITSGLVDPLACHWGRRPGRFAKRTWQAPVVDTAALKLQGGPLAAWLEDRLVPKILVASQTAVLEAVVDEAGAWVPGVPLISVLPAAGENPWLLAAALLAPAATAWALHQSAGAGLSARSLKIPASSLADLPMPVRADAWETAARKLRDMAGAGHSLDSASWLQLGQLLDDAWERDTDGLSAWWLARGGFDRDGTTTHR